MKTRQAEMLVRRWRRCNLIDECIIFPEVKFLFKQRPFQTLRAIIRFTCPWRADVADEQVGALICWNLWLSDKPSRSINSREETSSSGLRVTLDQFLSRMRDSFVLDYLPDGTKFTGKRTCIYMYIYIYRYRKQQLFP